MQDTKSTMRKSQEEKQETIIVRKNPHSYSSKFMLSSYALVFQVLHIGNLFLQNNFYKQGQSMSTRLVHPIASNQNQNKRKKGG